VPNTDRVARPSRLTPEDIARQLRAVEAYDRARRNRRLKKMLARGAFVVVVLGIWMRLLWVAGA